MLVQAAFIKDLKPNTTYTISIQSVFKPLTGHAPIQSKPMSINFQTRIEDDDFCYNEQTVENIFLYYIFRNLNVVL